jgi:hypothetical protein
VRRSRLKLALLAAAAIAARSSRDQAEKFP